MRFLQCRDVKDPGDNLRLRFQRINLVLGFLQRILYVHSSILPTAPPVYRCLPAVYSPFGALISDSGVFVIQRRGSRFVGNKQTCASKEFSGTLLTPCPVLGSRALEAG